MAVKIRLLFLHARRSATAKPQARPLRNLTLRDITKWPTPRSRSMMRRWAGVSMGFGRSVQLGGFDDTKYSSGDGRPRAAIRRPHAPDFDPLLLARARSLLPGRACRSLVLDHHRNGKTKRDQARWPAPDRRSSAPRQLLRLHQPKTSSRRSLLPRYFG